MTGNRTKTFLFALQVLASIFIALTACVFSACSNSEAVGAEAEGSAIIHCKDADTNISPTQEEIITKNDSLKEDSTITEPASVDSICTREIVCDSVSEDLPLDDSEYPYAGIPRIVIETENHQAIKDRENEIPAKLQIWGERAPESEVMNLTIRGRGNTSWGMPKKSYKIEFIDKQQILGMPENRDWALISNYADKTLIKNYLMYHLSAQIGAFYSPKCEFAELFLNGNYLGVYLLTETIKIGKNRVNIPQNKNSYIVEFDAKLRKGETAVHSYKIETKGKTYHIHEPKDASNDQLSTIENYITSFETFLLGIEDNVQNGIDQWVDVNEYVKHYWIQEFSKNPDAYFYSSVYFTWVKNSVIRMGPVWDFDLSFGGHSNESFNVPQGWYIKLGYWNKYLFKDLVMSNAVKQFWQDNKTVFASAVDSIETIAEKLQYAATNNFKRWDILNSTAYDYHMNAFETYDDAIEYLKAWTQKRIEWIDARYN